MRLRHLRQKILFSQKLKHPHQDDAPQVEALRLRILQQQIFEQPRYEDAQEATHQRDAVQV